MNQRYSITASRAVLDQNITDGELRTLSVLGLFTDDDGWCWPSQGKIAKMRGVSRKTINAHIGRLCELGYINVQNRRDQEGKQQSNMMQVKLDFPSAVLHEGYTARVTSDDQNRVTPGGYTNVPGENEIKEPLLSPSGGEESDSFLSGNSEQPKGSTTIRKAKKGYPTYQIPTELDTPGFRFSFEEWVTWRREELRKPVTDLAAKKTLDALLPFGAAWAISRMNQAIVRGWTGLVFSGDIPGSNHNGVFSSSAPTETAQLRR